MMSEAAKELEKEYNKWVHELQGHNGARWNEKQKLIEISAKPDMRVDYDFMDIRNHGKYEDQNVQNYYDSIVTTIPYYSPPKEYWKQMFTLLKEYRYAAFIFPTQQEILEWAEHWTNPEDGLASAASQRDVEDAGFEIVKVINKVVIAKKPGTGLLPRTSVQAENNGPRDWKDGYTTEELILLVTPERNPNSDRVRLILDPLADDTAVMRAVAELGVEHDFHACIFAVRYYTPAMKLALSETSENVGICYKRMYNRWEVRRKSAERRI